MTLVNSADLRSRFAEILATVVEKKQPVLVGRFGEPKAVLVDLTTYNIQQTVLSHLSRLKELNRSEIETLEILIDPKTRRMLIEGLKDVEQGNVISFNKV